MDINNVNTKKDFEKALAGIGEQITLHMKQEQKQKADNYRYLNQYVKKQQILFTGSSLMEQFPINEFGMACVSQKMLYNRGIGGYTTDDFLQEIDTLLFDLEPSKVFINIGTNDMKEWEDGRNWMTSLLKNYEQILKLSKERLPCAKFYLMAYYPVNPMVSDAQSFAAPMFTVRTNENINLVNKHMKELAAFYDYNFIDVNLGLTDENGNLKAEFTIEGIHMYANAYNVIFHNLKQYL